MPSYMAILLALHTRFTNLVPRVHECTRPRALCLKKMLFLVALNVCSLETLLRNIFTPSCKLKVLLFHGIFSPL